MRLVLGGGLALLVSGAVACGGSAVGVGDAPASDAGAGAVAVGGDAGGGGGTLADDGGSAASNPDASVAIHLRSTAAAVPHDDGLAGQTPETEKLGIRSLVLAKGADDPSPWTVFDFGANAQEVSLDDGADTVVAKVPAAQLRAGTYTVARVAISHVRYTVSTLVHSSGLATPGDLDTVEALSNGSIVDGAPRDRGWFTQTLRAGGYSFTRNGTDAPVPQTASTGGITLDTSGPIASYVFGVSLTVDPTIARDHSVTLEVNVNEDFRWRDEAKPGYVSGTWDTEPPAYETIVSFGANSFRVLVDAD